MHGCELGDQEELIFTEGSLLLSLLESSVDDGVLLITIPRQIAFQPLANVPPLSREVAT